MVQSSYVPFHEVSVLVDPVDLLFLAVDIFRLDPLVTVFASFDACSSSSTRKLPHIVVPCYSFAIGAPTVEP